MNKQTFIFFNAPINERSAQSLFAVVVQQIDVGFNDIVLAFSTSGGSVSDGIMLFNSLRALPATLTIHNIGNVDSIGTAIFLAGKNRYVCPHSTFMFHGVSREIGAGWHAAGNLREQLSFIDADQTRIASILADNTSLKLEKVQEYFRSAATINANEAVELGVAQEVRDIIVPSGSPVIPLVFES